MDDSHDVALLDTNRDELRRRISAALLRFDHLIRTSDPQARPPGSAWTVQQIAAHVLTVGHRYRDLGSTGDYQRGNTPEEVIAINQADIDAAMAPIPELADQLTMLQPQIDRFFDATTDDGRIHRFHCDAFVDGITLQTNWLGEVLMHGSDIAQAAEVPWDFPDRAWALVLRGGMQIAPAYVRADLPADTKATVAFTTPGARPYLMQVQGSAAQCRAVRPDDRPDAVLRAPASTLAQLFYQRIGPLTAARRGLRIAGGRRPWVALKLMHYFAPA